MLRGSMALKSSLKVKSAMGVFQLVFGDEVLYNIDILHMAVSDFILS